MPAYKIALTEPGDFTLELLQAVVTAGEGDVQREGPLSHCRQDSHSSGGHHVPMEPLQAAPAG